MSEWIEVSLTDIYEVASGLSKPADAFGTGYPFLSFKDVFGNYFLPEKLSQLVESSAVERQKGSIKRGDVFLTRTSETMHELGMSSVALKEYPNATFNGFTKRLRPKKDSPYEVHPEYLGYYLRSPKFRRGMLAFSTMSTRASLNNEMISRLIVRLPPIDAQKNIAKILKSLDDKIELNRQTNQTLEHIAQAIFKSWFVDFEPTRAKIAAKQRWQALHDTIETSSPTCYADQTDNAQNPPSLEETMTRAAMAAISGKSEEELDAHGCANAAGAGSAGAADQLNPETQQQLLTTAALFPDALVDSELGEIPEGWEVKSLSTIIEVIGGGTPKRSEESYWNGDIPWFSVKDAPNLSDIFVIDTIEKISELGLHKSSTMLLPVGTTIITARGTVGKLALVGTPMCMNQSCYGILGIDGFGPYFNYFNLREAIATLQRNTHGAVFDTITTQTFESYSMPVASSELIKRFEDLVTPVLKNIETNSREVTTLNSLRDSLLPKLLSGELAIAPNQTELESAL